MDDDDFEMDDVTEVFANFFAPPQPSFRRARWMDIPVLGMGFLCDLSKAVTNTLIDATNVLAGHANFNVQQDQFHEQAAREIETLIAGENE